MKLIKTKSYNFLLEMLVVIILFTFCSIIFVELFALSSEKSNKATIINNALNDVETYASLIKGGRQVSQEYKNDDYTIYVTKIDEGYNIKALYSDKKEIVSINVTNIGENYEK